MISIHICIKYIIQSKKYKKKVKCKDNINCSENINYVPDEFGLAKTMDCICRYIHVYYNMIYKSIWDWE